MDSEIVHIWGMRGKKDKLFLTVLPPKDIRLFHLFITHLKILTTERPVF